MGITILNLQLGVNCILKVLLLNFCFCNQFSFLIHLFFTLVYLFFSAENLRPPSPLRCTNVNFLFILQFMPFRFRELCNTFNFVILGRILFACCLRHTRNWLDLLPPMEVPCICTPHFTWQPVMATSKHDFYSHHECYLQTRD